MKSIVCPHCNSKWESSQSVSVCPFCHKPLISDNQLKAFDSMEILLVSVRNEYGIEVFDNAPKVKGILKDKAPELKDDIRLFSRALDSSAFKGYRLQVGDSSLSPALQKSKYILMDEEFMSEENAHKVLNWYRVLLDLPTIPNEQEEERRKREEEECRKREEEERRKREEEERRKREEEARRKREEEARRKREEEARRKREAEARRKREEEARRKREEEEARRKQAEMDESVRTLKEYEQLEKQQKEEEQKKSGSSGYGCFFGLVSFLFGGGIVVSLIYILSNGADFSHLQAFPTVCVVAMVVLALAGVSHDEWPKDRKTAVTVVIIILIIVFSIYMYTQETGH